MAPSGGGSTSAEVTVTGEGSTWSQNGASDLTIGHSSSGSATLNVLSQGTFNTGTDTTTVNATGSINIGGAFTNGTFNANGNVNVVGGSITRTSGSFNLAAGRTLTASSGAQIHLGGGGLNQTVQLSGGTTWNILDGADLITNFAMRIGNSDGVTTVTVDGVGSSLTTGNLISSWGSAGNTADVTLRNGASATVGGEVSLANGAPGTTGIISIESGATMTVGALTVSTNSSGTGVITVTGPGSSLTLTGTNSSLIGHDNSNGTATLNVLDGGTFSTGTGRLSPYTNGTINVDGGTLSLNGPLQIFGGALNFQSGRLEVHGSPITGIATLAVPANGELRGYGVYGQQIIGAAGSTIAATGDFTLGDASLASGFATAGNLQVNNHVVTLLNANAITFDSTALVTLGDGGQPGTLAAPNGLALNFGGNLTGHGTLDTPDDPANPLVNNGHLSGNSPDEPLLLPGHVRGVGSYDNVEFTGTFSPDSTPSTVILGSAAYAGTLLLDIGGLAPGSGYDRLNHILGDGIAHLGGTLEVSLRNGFMPAAGDSFEIISGAGITGSFASAILPELPGDLSWTLNYGANSVTLTLATSGLPGDYNQNGVVDAADYVVWRNNLGSDFSRPTTTPPALDKTTSTDGRITSETPLAWAQETASLRRCPNPQRSFCWSWESSPFDCEGLRLESRQSQSRCATRLGKAGR